MYHMRRLVDNQVQDMVTCLGLHYKVEAISQ